ncbi:hypothetical protein Ciccas_009948, partial [Cichlidogyrus casuarinus]
MSTWWKSLENSANLTKYATSALKKAQKKIDTVLDIEDEQSYHNTQLAAATNSPNHDSVVSSTINDSQDDTICIEGSADTENLDEAEPDKNEQGYDLDQLFRSPTPKSTSGKDDQSSRLIEDFDNTTCSDIELISIDTSTNGDSATSMVFPQYIPTHKEAVFELPDMSELKNINIEQLLMNARNCPDFDWQAKLVELGGMTNSLRNHLDRMESQFSVIYKERNELMETNNLLRSKIEHTGQVMSDKSTDLQALTANFSTRLARAEQKLQDVIRERDKLKSQLSTIDEGSSTNLQGLRKEISRWESVCAEKETRIVDLLKEGEKLANDQLAKNNAIKALRAKEKQLQSSIETHSYLKLRPIWQEATIRGLCLLHSLVRLVLDRDYNPLDLRFIDPSIRRREPSVLVLSIPRPGSTRRERSFDVRFPVMWNRLPSEIRTIVSHLAFRMALIRFLDTENGFTRIKSLSSQTAVDFWTGQAISQLTSVVKKQEKELDLARNESKNLTRSRDDLEKQVQDLASDLARMQKSNDELAQASKRLQSSSEDNQQKDVTIKELKQSLSNAEASINQLRQQATKAKKDSEYKSNQWFKELAYYQ